MHHNGHHVRMDNSERTYQEQKKAALAQSKMFQIQNEGAGSIAKATKNPKYGNVNYMAEEILGGAQAGFAQSPDGDPYNAPMRRPDSTGNLANAKSSTNQPQVDPSAFDERIGNMMRGGQGFSGYNDRRA